MNLQSIVRICPDQVSCDLNGEAAILNLTSGAYYTLDPVAATIWNLMEPPRTIASIVEALVEQYEVDAETCQLDLLELLENLTREGLVELTEPV